MAAACPLIAPSLLSADFSRLGEEARAMVEAGADWLHLDVMDGRFVPNITFGPAVVKAVAAHVDVPLDVHLMIAEPDAFLEPFREAGADVMSVHPESGPHLNRTLQRIRALGAKAGVVFNPSTGPEVVDWMLEDVDLLLVMSVNPGFGGQSFMSSQLRKVERLAETVRARGLDVAIEVDGGINAETGRRAVDAGATVLVAGNAAFAGGAARYADNLTALRG